MEDSAGPSNGPVCWVCDNVRTEREMLGNTCLACHRWFNLNIDFYKSMDDPCCMGKKNGNYCEDFACLACKIERYLSHNPFKNTMSKCVICSSPTYVCEKDPVCSNCGLLWQERHSYTKSKKCSCNPEESKVCQVCCLKKLVRHMNGKYLPTTSTNEDNENSVPKQIVMKTEPGNFYFNKFNVNCDISSIHSHLQERTKLQLVGNQCRVVLQKFLCKPREISTEMTNGDGGISSDTSSSVDVCIGPRKKRMLSLFGDTSDEEIDRQPPRKISKPSPQQHEAYNVTSVSKTCLRQQADQSLPGFKKIDPPVVNIYDTTSSDESISISTSEITFPNSDSCLKSNLDAANQFPTSFNASTLTPETEDSSRSPVIASKRKSQHVASKPANFYNNGNARILCDSSTKSDVGVQTEGFFEDLLPKAEGLHKFCEFIQTRTKSERPPPSQCYALLQEVLCNTITFCEPIVMRGRASSQPIPLNPNWNILSEKPNVPASQEETAKPTPPQEAAVRENKAKRSTKFRRDIIAEMKKKSAQVVLHRLSDKVLRRYGIDPNTLKPLASKKTQEQRSRKSSINSESSNRDSFSESSCATVEKLTVKTPAQVNFDLEELDYEGDSPSSTPPIKKAHSSKPINDRGSSKLSKESLSKTKASKSGKEKHQTKSSESKASEKESKKPPKEKQEVKVPKTSEAKESKNFDKPPNIRIPKKSSASSRPGASLAGAAPSAGLPALLQENLDLLKKGKGVSSGVAAQQKAAQKSSGSKGTEKTPANIESKTVEKPKTYQDVDLFHEEYPPGQASAKKKSILNICPPRKEDGNKAKVTINAKTQQPDRTNVSPVPPEYVAAVLQELEYVPASSPRPTVQGIRPFHPPRVRIDKRNAPSSVANDVSPENVAPAVSRSNFKRNRKSLFSSSSSGSESSSSESSGSESDSESTSASSEPSARAIQDKQTSNFGQVNLSESSSSCSTDGGHSPSSETSDELAGVASFIAQETGTLPISQAATEEKQEHSSFESAISSRSSSIFSPRRGPVPAVLVTPYRDEPDESSANMHDALPQNEEANHGDANEERSLVNEDNSQEETARISEQMDEEPDDDLLIIGLGDEDRFDEEYAEESDTNQSRSGSALRDASVPPPVDAATEPARSNSRPDQMPQQMPPTNRAPDPRTARRFSNPNAIPTARVTPQFEDRRHHPQPVVPYSVIPNIDEIISKGMCLTFVRTGECPPKLHETCVYCHDTNLLIVHAVIRSYCENAKKLPLAKKLIQDMLDERSPFKGFTQTRIGYEIVSIAISAFLEDTKEDFKHFAISKLIEPCVPVLPELIEKAISHAPDTPRAAHDFIKLWKKYTSASITISTFGWQKIIHVVRWKSWEELLETLAMALHHQRLYCPTEETIAKLFVDALAMKQQHQIERRVQETCKVLQGIGPQAFRNLAGTVKRDVLLILQTTKSPLLTTYMRLFEFQSLHPQQIQPNPLPPMHPLQQHIPPVQMNGQFLHNPAVPVNPYQQHVAPRTAPYPVNRHPVPQPPVQWPSTNEVSSILRSNALLPTPNTAAGLVGQTMHFENVRDPRQQTSLLGEYPNSTPNARPSALSRLGVQAANGADRILPAPPSGAVNQSNIPPAGLAHSNRLNIPSSVTETQPEIANEQPPQRALEIVPALVVPKPSQALDRNLFNSAPKPVEEEKAEESDTGASEEAVPQVPQVPQTHPCIQELDSLFAQQEFDGEKFKKLAELLIKSQAEGVNDKFMPHLLTLITTKPIYDAENCEEPLSLSAVTIRILYCTMEEGDATALNILESVLSFLYSKYRTAANEDDKVFYLEQSKEVIVASSGAQFMLDPERCTKNPKVLVFMAECCINKWEDSSPPQEQEGIEDFIASVTRAFYVLTEFHRVVEDFNVEKAIVEEENRVVKIALKLSNWVTEYDVGPPEVPCDEAVRATIAGALEDYNMAAMKNFSRFSMIVEGRFE